MTKEFNEITEIQKYYDKEINTYIFKEDGDYIDQVTLCFNYHFKKSQGKLALIHIPQYQQ